MNRLSCALAVALSLWMARPTLAVPQSSPQSVGSGLDLSQNPILPKGATTALTNAILAARTFKVEAYGAKCNNNIDDTVAFNAAFQAVRALLKNHDVGAVLDLPAGYGARRCIINGTVNATGIPSGRLTYNGNGTALYGRGAGKPVVDMLGSTGITWNQLAILSDSSSEPSYGFQMGRVDTTANNGGGAGMIFNGLNVQGAFTKAACYNLSGEGVTFRDPICKNVDTANTSYGLVQDGFNHFNITSDFVAELAPVDTGQSFNNNLFENTHLLSASPTGAPLWTGGTRQHRYIDGYGITYSGVCIDLFTEATGQNQSIDFDFHCEGNVANVFLVDGTVSSPTLYDLTFREGGLFPNGGIFKLGGSAMTATCQHCDVAVSFAATTVLPTARMFDNPKAWTYSGRAYAYLGSLWNQPAVFNGTLGIGNAQSPFGLGPVDLYGNAAAAYSCARRLNQGYTGPLCNVRRASDNLATDLFPAGDGSLDRGTFSAFCAGTTCSVVTAYDQSGNGNGASNATAANQPSLGLVTAMGGRACMTFGETSGYALSAPASPSLANIFAGTGGYISLALQRASGATNANRINNKGGWVLYDPVQLQQRSGTTGTWAAAKLTAPTGHIFDVEYSSTSLTNTARLGVDGSTATQTTTTQPTGTPTDDTDSPLVIGNSTLTGTTNGFGGYICEEVLWKGGAQSSSYLEAIRRNQGTFYGLSATVN